MNIEITLEEAKAIMHCFVWTNITYNVRSANDVLAIADAFMDRLQQLVKEEENENKL